MTTLDEPRSRAIWLDRGTSALLGLFPHISEFRLGWFWGMYVVIFAETQRPCVTTARGRWRAGGVPGPSMQEV